MLFFGLHIGLHNMRILLRKTRDSGVKTGLTKALVLKRKTLVSYSPTRVFISARSGTRTRTGVTAQGILSPSCLPFHHSSSVEWKKQSETAVCSAFGWAENETRTRDPNLGKVVLYQLSYFRNVEIFLSVSFPCAEWRGGDSNSHVTIDTTPSK